MKTIAFAMIALVLGLAAPAEAGQRKHTTTAAHTKRSGTHATSHKATADHPRRTHHAKKRTAHAHTAKSTHAAKSAKASKKHAAH